MLMLGAAPRVELDRQPTARALQPELRVSRGRRLQIRTTTLGRLEQIRQPGGSKQGVELPRPTNQR
jgi:hypothetical protein